MAPSSALPINAIREVEETQLEKMDPTLDGLSVYLHSILSVTASKSKEDDEDKKSNNALDEIDKIFNASSTGFLYMYYPFSRFDRVLMAHTKPNRSEIDMTKKRFTILAPSIGKFPKDRLLVGTLKWNPLDQ